MTIKKISLVLNTDDPEQEDLYQFARYLKDGKKRNASAFLRMLLDREYQKYLEKQKMQSYQGKRPQVIKNNGGIKLDLS